MDIEYLREFVAFSSIMNFSTAARALHVSQSTLSKHISEIEKELEVPLVLRASSPAERNTLTASGKVFLEEAQSMLRAFDRMVSDCRRASLECPPARIHSLYFAVGISPQVTAALDAGGYGGGRRFEYRKVDMGIRDALDNGEIDFAIHYEPHRTGMAYDTEGLRDEYGWIALIPEPVCFLVGTSNGLACASELDVGMIGSREVVNEQSASYASWYSTLETIFLEHGCPITMKLVPNDPRDGSPFPIGNRDICLCTERFAHYYEDLSVEGVVKKPPRGFDPHVYPYLVYRRDNTNSNVRAIVECMGGTAMIDEAAVQK